MAGGSLQTRLDLQPKDISYLQAMGHFSSVPKPLTWRQKLRVVLQASEALLYAQSHNGIADPMYGSQGSKRA